MRTRRLLLLLAAALAVLLSATAGLTAWYHAERAARARAHVAAGQRLQAEGAGVAAVEEYRAALRLERDDLATQRALALALLDARLFAEAEFYLADLLQQDPVSGPLNLAMARLRAAQTDQAAARQLYQRAIYGEWSAPDGEGRLGARFELAEYLTTRAARQDVLAELLRLKADIPEGATMEQLRLAELSLRAEAPDVAIDALQAALVNRPRDVFVLATLAEAEIAAGRSADARRTLRRALVIDPARRDLRERLTVVDRVLALDPTLPGLRLTTRTRRARDLLAAVVEQTAACDTTSAAAAERRVAEGRLREPRPRTSEAADDEFALAVSLWSAAAACRSGGAEAEAITEVLARVASTLEDLQP